MILNKRLTFECWNCTQEFSLLIQEESSPQQILKECPFCGKECFVNLSPYKDDVTVVSKTDSPQKAEIGKDWNFPKTIPTTKPEGE